MLRERQFRFAPQDPVRPSLTHSDPARPSQTQPDPVTPSQIQPVPVRSSQTQPNPTRPSQTLQDPVRPNQTQSDPARPCQTQSDPDAKLVVYFAKQMSNLNSPHQISLRRVFLLHFDSFGLNTKYGNDRFSLLFFILQKNG